MKVVTNPMKNGKSPEGNERYHISGINDLHSIARDKCCLMAKGNEEMKKMCPYAFNEKGTQICRLYRKDAFVCNQDDEMELMFCGAYKTFMFKQLTNKMDEMIGSLSFVSKSELYGP